MPLAGPPTFLSVKLTVPVLVAHMLVPVNCGGAGVKVSVLLGVSVIVGVKVLLAVAVSVRVGVGV